MRFCHSAEFRVLDRELFNAREEDPVHALLALKVFQAVLVEPARDRQEQAPLEEHDDRADDRPVAREAQAGLELPLVFVAEHVGQQHRVVVARFDGAPEDRLDRRVDVGVAIILGRAFLEQARAPLPAQVVFDLAHHAVNAYQGTTVFFQ